MINPISFTYRSAAGNLVPPRVSPVVPILALANSTYEQTRKRRNPRRRPTKALSKLAAKYSQVLADRDFTVDFSA